MDGSPPKATTFPVEARATAAGPGVIRRTCVAGVDIGTSATKVVVVDDDGAVVATAAEGYALNTPSPERAEQDPHEILDAVKAAVASAIQRVRSSGGEVETLCFSAAMHSLIALDAHLRPLTPSITWADNRATDQAERLRSTPLGVDLYRRTGTPLHAMAPLAKLLWFREEDPDLFASARRWVSIKEFVIERLTGELVVDHSIASATGLFSLRAQTWDQGALDVIGLGPDALSPLVPTTAIVGGFRAAEASELGVDDGCRVVVGAGDGALANVGVGAVHPGLLACTIGTSGAIRACVDQPTTDEMGRLFCYVLTDDRWIIGGPINNGGRALQWARDALFPDFIADDETTFERLDAAAARTPAGAGGLLFLPYLLGERAPHWNSDVRGAFLGLTVDHTREHMLRAVMEGVAMQLSTILEIVEQTIASRATDVRAAGGFARLYSWRRILAGVFGRDVKFPLASESSAWGAAVLGLLATGRIESLDWVDRHLSWDEPSRADPSEAAVYARLTEIFIAAYEPLLGTLTALARRQTSID